VTLLLTSHPPHQDFDGESTLRCFAPDAASCRRCAGQALKPVARRADPLKRSGAASCLVGLAGRDPPSTPLPLPPSSSSLRCTGQLLGPAGRRADPQAGGPARRPAAALRCRQLPCWTGWPRPPFPPSLLLVATLCLAAARAGLRPGATTLRGASQATLVASFYAIQLEWEGALIRILRLYSDRLAQ